MRIKPWVLTGTTALIAASALGVIILSADPADADTRLLVLFWAVLGVGFWAMVTTLFFGLRMNLRQAVWIGGLWAVIGVGTILGIRAGYRDIRLLRVILFVTLALSLIIWWRLRNGRT